MLDRLSRKFTDIIQLVSGKASISDKNVEQAIDEIKMALLEADVNIRVVRRFINNAMEDARGARVLSGVTPSQQFIKIIHDRIVWLLGDEKVDLALKGPDTVSVLLFLGLQGSGKTTTAAKLAYHLHKKNRKPLLVAADLVRPAAIEQLSVLGRKIGIEVYKEENTTSLKVVKNALHYAAKNQFDTVIIDTAGRLHIDDRMMDEIKSISKAAQADEVLLVADAMTGQHAVDIAKEFNEKVGISGVILTKFDSDTRGGAALSIKNITGKPIKYIGVGEKEEDLEPFYPQRIASRILGMGDVVTLVEKAQETIEQEEAEDLQRKIESKTFDFEDYLSQFRRMKKMGSMRSLIDMIPGLKGNVDPDQIDMAEMKREEAIILSMTRKERKNPRIIGPSRRKRIARGSGTAVFDVNKLLKKFEKTKNMMKKVSKNKNYQAQMMSGLGMQ